MEYIISYFSVGLLLSASSILHKRISNDKIFIGFIGVFFLWPIIILGSPEFFLTIYRKDPLQKTQSKKINLENELETKFNNIANSENKFLSESENNSLKKIASIGIRYTKFFPNNLNFNEIIQTYWELSIPPSAFYEYKNFTQSLQDDYNPRPRVSAQHKSPDWYIGFSNEFMKSITKIDRKKQGRILEAIGRIAEAPLEAHGDTIKPLTADLSGLWRCRLGDDRLIYFPDKGTKKVTLISFSSRGDAYE